MRNVVFCSAFSEHATVLNVLNSNPSLDDLGEDLPDKEAAWRQATITAGEIFKALDGSLRPGQEWTLEVTDEARQPVYIIHIDAKQMG